MAARRSAKKEGQCTCNPMTFLVALVFLSVGVYGLANGFVSQLNGGDFLSVVPWYFAGALLVAVGKIMKHKAGGTCQAHGMK